MSILIKGLEIPTDEHLLVIIIPDGTVIYKLADSDEDWIESDKETAVPVPEHGRLGDLDAAVEKLKRLREFHADDSRSAPFIVTGINQCIDILSGREAPTIIPADKEVDNGTA